MMMTDTEIAAEVRSLMDDVGDAATAAAGGMALTSTAPRARRRPVSLVGLSVAAAGLLAIGGAVVLRDGRPDDRASLNVESTTSLSSNRVAPEVWPTAFRDLFAAALPDGFVALLADRNPLQAVAYNERGIRLSVIVDLGNSEGAAKGVPLDEYSALTPEGDRVMGNVMYNYDERGSTANDIADVAAARSVLPDLVAQVAAGLTGPTRSEVLDAAYPHIDSAQLRSDISAALAPTLGAEYGNQILSGANFSLMYGDDDALYLVTGVRSSQSLPDGITNPSATTTTGMRSVNGWQIVVASSARAAGQPPVGSEKIQQILATIEPMFSAWRAGATPEVGCATRVVQIGDSAENVAERFGVTIDDLERANPDLEANFQGGAMVVIPCTSTAPIPSTAAPVDTLLATGVSQSEWSFEATNGVVRSSALLTYTVSAGFNTEADGGTIRITASTFDGTFVRDALILLQQCNEPTQLIDDLSAPIEAVPFRCGSTGDVVTIDLYSGQSALTIGMSGVGPTIVTATTTTAQT